MKYSNISPLCNICYLLIRCFIPFLLHCGNIYGDAYILNVTFTAINSSSTDVIGTITVNDSFPIIVMLNNDTIHDYGDIVKNVSRNDSEIQFLLSQYREVKLLSRENMYNTTTLLCDCLINHELLRCEVRQQLQPKITLRTHNGSCVNVSLLEKTKSSLYHRWLQVYDTIINMSRPDNTEIVFGVSYMNDFVYCSAWNPAPLPFQIALRGYELYTVSSHSFRNTVYTMATVSNATLPRYNTSHLICSIQHSSGWTMYIKDPYRTGVRKLPDDAVHITYVEHGMDVYVIIVVMLTVIIVKAMLCALALLNWTDRQSITSVNRLRNMPLAYINPYYIGYEPTTSEQVYMNHRSDINVTGGRIDSSI
nr:membrane protein b151 [Mastomys natalensis cytomegalovirus 3]WEG69967.1 membrane protein b151 [Mastomys natalensis cytomegalovirus 3]WEG70107.1 membrane protein b151 [Mastomys natalensis cytomegalovirus 3]WEG70247.1 membrane protein b151 [Mastomys natalensis cytomegalovirus 3]WEG70527.1 membrane protein b151 [Mastomys natalensis cytomegalovirus 3]